MEFIIRIHPRCIDYAAVVLTMFLFQPTERNDECDYDEANEEESDHDLPLSV
jgi:hypothetical protein